MLARLAFRFFASKFPLGGTTLGNSGIYAMFFTCNKCNTRAGKTFTKKAYHTGVVLIRCEGCDNLHLVADNLGWFRDKGTNIEDLMREQGKLVSKFSSDKEVLEYAEEAEEGTQACIGEDVISDKVT